MIAAHLSAPIAKKVKDRAKRKQISISGCVARILEEFFDNEQGEHGKEKLENMLEGAYEDLAKGNVYTCHSNKEVVNLLQKWKQSFRSEIEDAGA
jgi:hypothetical protein